jgi:hypothetical protein
VKYDWPQPQSVEIGGDGDALEQAQRNSLCLSDPRSRAHDPAAASRTGYPCGLAYRMLSSMAEAEDAVQDAYIRWHRIGAGARRHRESARLAQQGDDAAMPRPAEIGAAQRESYVGPWLPEPVTVGGDGLRRSGADLSVAVPAAAGAPVAAGARGPSCCTTCSR